MSFWGWAWTVAAAWGVLSALIGIGWLLAGRRIFRKPPAPPRIVRRDGQPISQREVDGIREIISIDSEFRRGPKAGA